MPVAIIILLIVFFLIIVRRIGNIYLQIWQIMLLGAIAVLVFGEIEPAEALKAIDWDVMLFLLGMFIVGQALEESGYLSYLSFKVFHRARTVERLTLGLLFGFGAASAILMNDTLAIIGTPVVLALARKHGLPPKMLLLTLAFAVTIGSVVSPIGNPQNLLIAINSQMANPFITFARYLFIPTVINLFIAFLFLKLFYREEFHDANLNHEEEPLRDPKLAFLARLALLIVLGMVGLKILVVFWKHADYFRLTYIALAAAAPIVLFSPKRIRIIRQVDWPTLVFFAAMFVLMGAVWESYFFQGIIDTMNFDITKLTVVLLVSVVLSQLISNVPLAALFLPLLVHAGASGNEMIALAAGCTIAGNMLILGAASNVIIIQNAETKAGQTLTFWEFARIGIPLTAVNVFVYWLFLRVL